MQRGSRVKEAIKKLAWRLRLVEVATAVRKDQLLVLAYHGVLSSPRPYPFNFHHTVEEFFAHMDWVLSHFAPIDASDLALWLEGRLRSPKPPVLVTFDDGYRNQLLNAVPVLLAKGIPAVFFLPTAYIGTQQILWPDELFLRVLAWPEPDIRAPQGSPAPKPTQPKELINLAVSFREQVKDLPNSERLAYFEYLRTKTPDPSPTDDPELFSFMTWDEARSLAQKGFTVGSHSHSHPILSSLQPDEVFQELHTSKALIEQHTRRPCNLLSYPNGRLNDAGESTYNAARTLGYTAAFYLTDLWNKLPANPFTLRRVCPPGHSDLATFSFYASGLRSILK